MEIDQIDSAIRGATASLLLVSALLFLRDSSSYAARFGGALSLSAIFYLLLMSPLLGLCGFGVQTLLGVIGNASIPLFWLFARAWFDDDFRPRRRDLGIALGYLGLWLVHNLVTYPAGGLARTSTATVYTLLGWGLVGHALWTAWRGRDEDLIEPRRRQRLWFVVLVGLFILWAVSSEFYARSTDNFHDYRLVNAALLFAVVLTLAVQLFGLRRDDMFAPAPDVTPPPRSADPADPRLAAALDRLMTHDRIYRTEALTIGVLANRLGVPDYRLRQLINGALGFRNFNDYLNSARLAEVKLALADPAQIDVPILTIAIDAGFGSVAPFNRAFKAATGATPRDFRRAALGAESAD